MDRISGEISGIRETMSTMATKEELVRVEESLSTKIDDVENKLTTKIDDVEKNLNAKIDNVEKKLTKKIDNVEKKLTRKIDDNIDYSKLLDQELSDHRRNTEMHTAGMRKA